MSADPASVLDARIGSAIRRVARGLNPARVVDEDDWLDWYTAQLEQAAKMLESGEYKPDPVIRMRVQIEPFDTDHSVEGLAEKLLEMVFRVAVGSIGFTVADAMQYPKAEPGEVDDD